MQSALSLCRASHDEQSAGVHVEPVDGKSLPRTAVTGAHERQSRHTAAATRHAQHAVGLVHHHNVVVLINYLQLTLKHRPERVGLHIKTLHHVAQQRTALARARRIEVSVTAKFARR